MTAPKKAFGTGGVLSSLARLWRCFAWQSALAIVAVMLFGISVARADSYPSQPIRMVVGFPPGGTTDVICRFLAQELSIRLGRPVVVENRAGRVCFRLAQGG